MICCWFFCGGSGIVVVLDIGRWVMLMVLFGRVVMFLLNGL